VQRQKQIPSLRCGMTNNKTGNGSGEIRGFFDSLRSLRMTA
jgi:hypothetical protein